MSYEAYLARSVPTWLQGNWGQRFMRAVGRRMDQVVQLARDAGNVQFPKLAPSDALPYIAIERSLPRGPTETEDAHRSRLDNAWEIWGGDNTPGTGVGGGGGTHLGMLKELATAGIPTGPNGATIVQQNGRWAQLDNTGALVLGDEMNCVLRMDLTGAINSRPGWTFDGRDNFWSIFGIVFPAPVTVDAAFTLALNRVVEKWRPAKALYAGAWVIQAGQTLGWPTGRTLGTEPNLGGNTITFVPGARRDDLRIGYHLP